MTRGSLPPSLFAQLLVSEERKDGRGKKQWSVASCQWLVRRGRVEGEKAVVSG